MKTEKKIKRLEKEIEMTKEFLVPLENIGIEASVIANEFLSMTAENFDEVKKITALFPPSGKLFELTFAGKDAIPTQSPFSIHVSNYSHCEATTATVKYRSEKLNIWIKLPLSNFSHHRAEVTKEVWSHNKMHVSFLGYNVYVTMGAVQAYAGGDDKFGSRVTYAENDLTAKKFNDTFTNV